jgi:predicted metal-dependent peptidase
MQKDRLIQARTNLLLAQPFFGTLALKLQLVESSEVPTMATDGSSILWNPQFASTLSMKEIEGVLCHEVLHCAAGHPWRRGLREMDKWNAACDYAINPLITKSGMLLPRGGLDDPAYHGMSAEEIYAKLPSVPSGRRPGEVLDGDNPLEEAEWKAAVSAAAQEARLQGKLPASLDRFVGEALRPRVDWRAVLRRFVQSTSRLDYSWKYPARRFLPAGLYLPSMRSESLPPIVCAVDTSGSIDDNLLAQFSSELTSIIEEARPEVLYVVYCDARVQRVEEYLPGDPLRLKPKGGGGTDFSPVFRWIKSNGIEPACLIYLTDLEGRFPSRAPDYPVLWASTMEREAPFGETIYLKGN